MRALYFITAVLSLLLFLGCSIKSYHQNAPQKRVVEETIIKKGVRLIEVKSK